MLSQPGGVEKVEFWEFVDTGSDDVCALVPALMTPRLDFTCRMGLAHPISDTLDRTSGNQEFLHTGPSLQIKFQLRENDAVRGSLLR